MAWTQGDLDALKRAIALGALEVEHPLTGKVKYRSLADMMKTVDIITAELSDNQKTIADDRVATGICSGFIHGGGFFTNRLLR